MIIDSHTHLLAAGHWPPAWWDHVATEWAAAKPGRRFDEIRDRIEPGLLDEDGTRMISRMDRSGVDVSVVLPIDWGPDFQSQESIDRANKHAVEMATAFPGRIVPFTGIDPRRPEALNTLRQRQREGRLHGLKFYPGCGWDPTGAQAWEIYDFADRAGVPVLFHTGDPLPILDRAVSNPARLLPIAEELPNLKIWLGHAGAPNRWDEACSVAEASANVKLEMSVWLWDDSDDEARATWLEKMTEGRDRFGADRLLFGTDHVSGPKVRGESFLTTVLGGFLSLGSSGDSPAAFSDDELAKILGRNALVDIGDDWAATYS